MKVSAASIADLGIVASWIDSEIACIRWAGPTVSYPIELSTLAEQIRYTPQNSYIARKTVELSGFGQLLHMGEQRYHLARIIIAPDQQNAGLGGILCETLIGIAQENDARLISLKVSRANPSALQLYLRIGFQEVNDKSNSDSLYMVKNLLPAGLRSIPDC